MDKNDFRKEIKRDLKAMKRNKIISALIFVALGVVLLAWPGATLFAVSKAVGLILAIGGVVAVVMYFINGSRAIYSYAGLAGGVVVAVLGIWLFCNPTFLINLIPTIVGLILIISGFVNLSEAITIKKEHDESILVTVILAVITIVLGLLILLLQQQFAELVTRIMGIALVYDGVADLLFISRLSSAARTVELTARQMVHDAEAVDVTETVKEVEPEETPVEETPAEESAPEAEAFAEEASVEDTSAEESTPETVEPVPETEETPVEAPADENPAGDDSLIAQPDEFEPDEETPSQTPVEEAPTEETPTETETFIDETSTED